MDDNKKNLIRITSNLINDVYGDTNRRFQKIIILYTFIIKHKYYLKAHRKLELVILEKLEEFLKSDILNYNQKLELIRIKEKLIIATQTYPFIP